MTKRKKSRKRYVVQLLENVKINRKYVEKRQQNLGSTNIEKKDDIKDCVNSVWRQIKDVVTNSANQVLRMEKK